LKILCIIYDNYPFKICLKIVNFYWYIACYILFYKRKEKIKEKRLEKEYSMLYTYIKGGVCMKYNDSLKEKSISKLREDRL
jgi:hypothetical protein